LDVRVGFPFAFSSANAGAERATDEIIASSLAWALAQCRSHERAAYSRPTVGALAEAPSLGGGASGFWALERGQRQLSERLHVIECDIAQLPMHVDMLVVPSNEWLRNPGWGAMDALYRLGGAELAEWVYAQQGTAHAHGGPPSSAVLSSGQVRTSLAYGAINASYLCHAVGISFYDAVDYMQVVTHQLQQALAQARPPTLARSLFPLGPTADYRASQTRTHARARGLRAHRPRDHSFALRALLTLRHSAATERSL
jgi:hypothetical protein